MIGNVQVAGQRERLYSAENLAHAIPSPSSGVLARAAQRRLEDSASSAKQKFEPAQDGAGSR